MTIKSKLITLSLTSISLIILEAPNTAKTLKILLPIKLPKEILSSPLTIATNEVINSGNEVPNATTVTPITNSETPKSEANLTAFATNNLEPKAKPKEPIEKYKIIRLTSN